MRFCNPARLKRNNFRPNFVRPNLLSKVARDERGVTAIEFALVLGPFLTLLFGIISVGFYFFSMFSLEHAIEVASRQIRIGAAPPAAATFKTAVCANLPAYMVCSGEGDKIRINVQNSTNYTASAADCLDTGTGELIAAGSYLPGAANEVVIVTICFEWNLGALPNMIYWISPTSARMGDGRLLLSASTVFANEP